MLSSSKMIQSAAGEIPAAQLGHIQCHEHIYLRKGPSYESNPALCMEDYDRSLRELQEYRAAGGGAIVDAQPGFFGRDPRMLRKLSEDSGVQILAVTGFHKLMFEEPGSPLQGMTEDQLTAHFAGEITTGMADPEGNPTDIRAAFVKVAFEPGGLTHPVYGKLFRAAARAAAHTGAPVLVHTEKNTDMLELLAFFNGFGVSSDRVLICHLDRTNYDAAYHCKVLQTGCCFCYDSVNRTKYVSHEQELDLITAVCAAGFEDRIVLSLDTTAQRLRAYGAPDMGLDYILTTYIPMLLDRGITREQTEKMCRLNAAGFLTK